MFGRLLVFERSVRTTGIGSAVLDLALVSAHYRKDQIESDIILNCNYDNSLWRNLTTSTQNAKNIMKRLQRAIYKVIDVISD